MKKKIYSKLTVLILLVGSTTLSSCLKDNRFVDFAASKPIAEFTISGLSNFGKDAITESGDTIVRQFAVNIASPSIPTSDTKITLAVDNSLIAAYAKTDNTVSYLPMPANAYVFTDLSVTIAKGTRTKIVSVTFYKNKLDPSLSYMLPIVIKDASGLTISGNFGVHYYHFIGNDFAGSYIWDYRRWQNGTGPGTTLIPPDITGLGRAGTIYPVTPTEFMMETGYNGTGVMYDVKFTRTVVGGVIHYSDWSVTFDDDNLALWTAVGISNMVPPVFTIPPPATSADPKVFEINYVSGGASGRYIDDTYHK